MAAADDRPSGAARRSLGARRKSGGTGGRSRIFAELPEVRLPVHDLAAIDVDGLAGDLGGPSRREERHHVGHILGSLPAAERGYRANLLGCPLFVWTAL